MRGLVAPIILIATLLIAAAAPASADRLVTVLDSPAAQQQVVGQAQTQKKKAAKKTKKSGQKDKKPARKTKTAKPAKAPAPPAKPKEPWDLPMTASIVRSSSPACEPSCPEWISVEGEFTGNSPAVFRKALKLAGKKKLPVIISTPGGSVNAAVEIGRMIRKAKLDVAVGWTRFEGCKPTDKACKLPKESKGVYRGEAHEGRAFCNSACPLVLAAGTQRLSGVWSYVGVHQVRTTWVRERVTYRERYRIVKGKKKVIDRKIVSRKTVKAFEKHGLDKAQRKRLAAYLKEMGIGLAMLDDMEKAPPSSLYRLDLTRQEDLKLITSRDTVALFASDRICRSGAAAANCVLGDVPPPAARQDEVTSEGSTSERLAAIAARSQPGELPEIVGTRRAVSATRTSPPSLKFHPLQKTTSAGQRSGEPEMAVGIARSNLPGCEPNCDKWIVLDGTITRSTPVRFKRILDYLNGRRIPVVVRSDGGDFDAALQLGRLIRIFGLDVIVAESILDCPLHTTGCKYWPASTAKRGRLGGGDNCSAACVLVLARNQPRPNERWYHRNCESGTVHDDKSGASH